MLIVIRRGRDRVQRSCWSRFRSASSFVSCLSTPISTLRSMNTKASCASEESNPRIAAIGSCIGTRIARAALPAGADIRFRDQFHADSPSRRQKSATAPTERPPGTSRERRIIAPLDPLLQSGGMSRQCSRLGEILICTSPR